MSSVFTLEKQKCGKKTLRTVEFKSGRCTNHHKHMHRKRLSQKKKKKKKKKFKLIFVCMLLCTSTNCFNFGSLFVSSSDLRNFIVVGFHQSCKVGQLCFCSEEEEEEEEEVYVTVLFIEEDEKGNEGKA